MSQSPLAQPVERTSPPDDLELMRRIEELLGALEHSTIGLAARVGESAAEAERTKKAAVTTEEARAVLAEAQELAAKSAEHLREIRSASASFRDEYQKLNRSFVERAATLDKIAKRNDDHLREAKSASTHLQSLLQRLSEEGGDLDELKEVAATALVKAGEVRKALDEQRAQSHRALDRLNEEHQVAAEERSAARRESAAALRGVQAVDERLSAQVRRLTFACVLAVVLLFCVTGVVVLAFGDGGEENPGGIQRAPFTGGVVEATGARDATPSVGPPRSSEPRPIYLAEARVAVLNSVGKDGLADAAADALRRRNIAVVSIGDTAPRGGDRSTVHFRPGSEPAATELAELIGGAPLQELTPTDQALASARPRVPLGVSVVLVLGRGHDSRRFWAEMDSSPE